MNVYRVEKDKWSPENEYYLRSAPTSGRYQKFDLEVVLFLLVGNYIKFERSLVVAGDTCHYFVKAD